MSIPSVTGLTVEDHLRQIEKICKVKGIYVEEAMGSIFIKDAKGLNIAYFKVEALTGCCGIQLSTGAYVANTYRGRGLGTLLNTIRIKAAKRAGYGILLCTDRKHNAPQAKILKKNGWEEIATFENPRTHNIINIHIHRLGRDFSTKTGTQVNKFDIWYKKSISRFTRRLIETSGKLTVWVCLSIVTTAVFLQCLNFIKCSINYYENVYGTILTFFILAKYLG